MIARSQLQLAGHRERTPPGALRAYRGTSTVDRMTPDRPATRDRSELREIIQPRAR